MNIGDKKPSFLIADQFLLQKEADRKTHVYCFRPQCDGCKYQPYCKNKTVEVEVGEGFNIRRAFQARKGFKIVAIDYQQIELRVAAQLSNETVWINAFNAGEDLHRTMAKIAFKTNDPTDSERSAAKSVNFGAIYLCSAKTLSGNSSLSLDEAEYVLKEWWKALTNYQKWSNNQYKKVEELYRQGIPPYVTTILGRRRYVDDLMNQLNKIPPSGKGRNSLRNRIHRLCVNSPVQGSATELMKLGIVEVTKWIEKENLLGQIRPLMTVHDEMVFEVRDDADFETICRKAASKMALDNHPILNNWKVRIGTDIEYGDNWAIMEKMKERKDKAPQEVEPVPEITTETVPDTKVCLIAPPHVTDDDLEYMSKTNRMPNSVNDSIVLTEEELLKILDSLQIDSQKTRTCEGDKIDVYYFGKYYNPEQIGPRQKFSGTYNQCTAVELHDAFYNRRHIHASRIKYFIVPKELALKLIGFYDQTKTNGTKPNDSTTASTGCRSNDDDNTTSWF